MIVQCQTLAGDAGPVTGGAWGWGAQVLISKMGKLQDKGKLGKLGKFHVQVYVYSGNVHASDCGSVHWVHG